MGIAQFVAFDFLVAALFGTFMFFWVAIATGAPDRRITWLIHPIAGVAAGIFFYTELGLFAPVAGIVGSMVAYRALYWYFNQFSPSIKKEKEPLMKWLVFVLCILGMIGMVVFVYVKHYQVERDVDSWMSRAQVAADREDMHEYMVTLRENMQAYGLTKGHTALIFTNPKNDMGLQYQSVTRIIERLDGLKNLSKAETAYQVALDDIRGTIRELPKTADGWTWITFWWLWIPGIVLLLIAVVIAVSDSSG